MLSRPSNFHQAKGEKRADALALWVIRGRCLLAAGVSIGAVREPSGHPLAGLYHRARESAYDPPPPVSVAPRSDERRLGRRIDPRLLIAAPRRAGAEHDPPGGGRTYRPQVAAIRRCLPTRLGGRPAGRPPGSHLISQRWSCRGVTRRRPTLWITFSVSEMFVKRNIARWLIHLAIGIRGRVR